MKKFLKVFFISLGVLFLIIILAVGVFFIVDPFNLKSLPDSDVTVQAIIKTTTKSNQVQVDNVDKNPLLNEEQEATLESLGVDPTDLPTQITPEMEACFVSKLGEARVIEITAGDTPTFTEFIQVQSCL
jgi:hypothetical protein